MINNVTFMGREECLTKPVKKAVAKSPEYFSPFANIERGATETAAPTREVISTYYEYLPINNQLKEVPVNQVVKTYETAAEAAKFF